MGCVISLVFFGLCSEGLYAAYKELKQAHSKACNSQSAASSPDIMGFFRKIKGSHQPESYTGHASDSAVGVLNQRTGLQTFLIIVGAWTAMVKMKL